MCFDAFAFQDIVKVPVGRICKIDVVALGKFFQDKNQ